MAQDSSFERLAERFSEKVRQLSDSEGYFDRFYELTAQYGNQRAAWEAIEEERRFYGLGERFTSYESFRVVKHRHWAGSSLVRLLDNDDFYRNAS